MSFQTLKTNSHKSMLKSAIIALLHQTHMCKGSQIFSQTACTNYVSYVPHPILRKHSIPEFLI